jgi:hypothetical protein
LEREARPLSNLKKRNVLVRRFRLGCLKFLFQTDRIDQIAAVTTVTCTDRSKSRWKQKTNEPTGRGSAPKLTATFDPLDIMT